MSISIATASAMVNAPRALESILLPVTTKHPIVSGIEWILENRTQPNGRKLSMRGFSLAAGLSGGHVEQILKGRIKPEGLTTDVVQRLADAGGVTLAWLTGETRPPPEVKPTQTVERDDLYPDRPVAIAVLRGQGYPEWAVAALQAVRRDGDKDPGLDGEHNWFDIARDILRYGEAWNRSPSVQGNGDAGDFKPRLKR